MSRLIEALKLTGRRRFAQRAVASCRSAGRFSCRAEPPLPAALVCRGTVQFLIKIKVAFFKEREALANLEDTCFIVVP